MNLSEYLDPKQFPLTTVTRYSPDDQVMMDHFNWGTSQEALENGSEFTAEEKARHFELEAKSKVWRDIIRQIKEGTGASETQLAVTTKKQVYKTKHARGPAAIKPGAWYQSPGLFPMTTRGHYTLKTQIRMDKYNLKSLRKALEKKTCFLTDNRIRAEFEELRFKEVYWDKLVAGPKSRKPKQKMLAF
jgi:hypothetical protein